MRYGFTGTQTGTTSDQLSSLKEFILSSDELSEAHHGDCIGADEEFFLVVRAIHPSVRIIGHIPDNDTKRAFCDNDENLEPKPYRERNQDIVNQSDLIIACPKTFTEQLRSGTWMTIRMVRKTTKPLVIIWPDGKYEYANQSN